MKKRAFAAGHSLYPAREDPQTALELLLGEPSNDVSPWPQADRVNPTQGELAEDRNLASKRRFPTQLSTQVQCWQRVAGDDEIFSVMVKKGTTVRSCPFHR